MLSRCLGYLLNNKKEKDREESRTDKYILFFNYFIYFFSLFNCRYKLGIRWNQNGTREIRHRWLVLIWLVQYFVFPLANSSFDNSLLLLTQKLKIILQINCNVNSSLYLGLKNLTALGNITQWQKLEYDFKYNHLDIETNIVCILMCFV